ncbi:MAG: AI-2E family transporter [Myxococcales bacterium]|nr:AI-2E family transporter [Myxococcales bacterium]
MSEQERDSEAEGPRAGILERLWGFSRLWGFLLFLLALVLLFNAVVLPFVFGTLIAYLLEPLVRRMGPRLGRGGSVAMVYLGLLALLAGFFGGLLPAVVSDLSTLRDSTPEVVETFNQEWLPRAGNWLERTFPDLGPDLTPDGAKGKDAVSELVVEPQADGSFRIDMRGAHLEIHESGSGWVVESHRPRKDSFAAILREIVASKGDELTEVVTGAVRSLVTGVAAFLTDFVIAFLVAAFILVDIDRIQRFIRSLVPADHRGTFEELLRGIDEGMAGVVRGQILICMINGTLAYLGLLLFGVHYSLLLAMIVAVLSIIPVAGVLISTIPILGVALVSGDLGLQGLAFGKSAMMLGWLVLIHLIEANWLNPRIIGIASNIHPVVLIFALLAGLESGGPVGAVLAIPVASVIQTVFLYARRHSDVFQRPTRGSSQRASSSYASARPPSGSHPAAQSSGSRPVLVDEPESPPE